MGSKRSLGWLFDARGLRVLVCHFAEFPGSPGACFRLTGFKVYIKRRFQLHSPCFSPRWNHRSGQLAPGAPGAWRVEAHGRGEELESRWRRSAPGPPPVRPRCRPGDVCSSCFMGAFCDPYPPPPINNSNTEGLLLESASLLMFLGKCAFSMECFIFTLHQS